MCRFLLDFGFVQERSRPEPYKKVDAVTFSNPLRSRVRSILIGRKLGSYSVIKIIKFFFRFLTETTRGHPRMLLTCDRKISENDPPSFSGIRGLKYYDNTRSPGRIAYLLWCVHFRFSPAVSARALASVPALAHAATIIELDL